MGTLLKDMIIYNISNSNLVKYLHRRNVASAKANPKMANLNNTFSREGLRAVPSIKLPNTNPLEMESTSRTNPLKEPDVRLSPHTAQSKIEINRYLNAEAI